MRLNYMSSELEEYKNSKIIELKNQYNINYSIITNTYNQLLYETLNSKTKNKRLVGKMMIARYNVEIQNLKNTLNSNIENILNFSISENSNKFNNKNAILIGMNYFRKEHEFFGSINNAIAVEDKLKKTYNFNNIDLIIDINETINNKEIILEKLKNLLINSSTNDLIFIYYSGISNDYTNYRAMMYLNSTEIILNHEMKTIIEEYLKKDVTLVILLDSFYINNNILSLKYQYLGDNNLYDKYIENSNQSLDTEGNIILINGILNINSKLETKIDKINGAIIWSFLQTLSTNINPTWREVIVNMRKLLDKSEFKSIPQFYTNNILNMDSKISL